MKYNNRRSHRRITSSSTEGNKGDVDLTIENADAFVDDGYFNNLINDEIWISFSKNSHHLNSEDRGFATTIHKNNTDKYLVSNS